MSSSLFLSPPLPPVRPRHSLELLTVRHGERVDQAFGNDWRARAFRLHHPHAAVRAHIPKPQQSIVLDGQGGYRVVEPSSSPSSAAPPPRAPFHHASYVRFNLNMPESRATHLPPRPIENYADDPPLTMCGHWQATTVGAAMRGIGIAAVFTSPALRCVQTAEEIVQGCRLKGRKGWPGIRIEPGLFEWMGWYSQPLPFLSPAALVECGFNIDAAYQPLSSYPSVGESFTELYVRTGQLVQQLVSMEHGGNVLLVAHAGSHDCATYSLLHAQLVPSAAELELGSRVCLYSQYCGISRVKFDAKEQAWQLADDTLFTLTHSPNELFSFRSSLLALERKVGAAPPRITMATEEALMDLHFSRLFGFLLDTVHSLASHIRSLVSLTDHDLLSLVRSVADPIASSISPIIPEWSRLASTCDGALQTHVIRCFLCVELLLKPDPRAGWYALSLRDRNVLSWAVLLHDIAKVMQRDEVHGLIKRDPIHPFTSAILAAKIFARMGFSHGGSSAHRSSEVDAWEELVQSAIIRDNTDSDTGNYTTTLYPLKHDNALLPSILAQLVHLFGSNTLASEAVMLVLLHQSIPFIAAFPPAAPLRDEDVVSLLDERMVRLLGMLHVCDSGSYQLAHRELQAKYIHEIWDKVQQLELVRREKGAGAEAEVEHANINAHPAGTHHASDGSSSGMEEDELSNGVDAVVLTADNAHRYGVHFPLNDLP